MNGRNLLLQRTVHHTMPCEQSLLLKLRRHDDGVEGLSAAAGHVLDGDIGGGELRLQSGCEGFGCDLSFCGSFCG